MRTAMEKEMQETLPDWDKVMDKVTKEAKKVFLDFQDSSYVSKPLSCKLGMHNDVSYFGVISPAVAPVWSGFYVCIKCGSVKVMHSYVEGTRIGYINPNITVKERGGIVCKAGGR